MNEVTDTEAAYKHNLRGDLVHRNKKEKKDTLYCKVRSYLFNKYNIWNIWDLPFFPYSMRYRWYDFEEKWIIPFFYPQNKRYRKVIPKVWNDVSGLIIIVNFEFIKGFYEDEYMAGTVDWEGSSPSHVKFAKWLESAYDYITIERPALLKQQDNSYPPLKTLDEMFNLDSYDEKVQYAEVRRIETLISKKDTKIITEMVKYREMLWT